MHTVNGEKKIRLAFFDVDGVLSAPQYPVPAGDMAIGFTTEDWFSYCEEKGEAGYACCRPVPCVADFAASLKAEGTHLYVLSTCFAKEEPVAKKAFIDRHYPDLFDALLFVPEDLQKLDMIEKKAVEKGCSLQECALIEDTYATLLAAFTRGITCIHLSNIVAGNISR